MTVRPRHLALAVTTLAVVVVAAGTVQVTRPVPAPTVRASLPLSYTVLAGGSEPLPWPTEGQAALYLPHFGWLGSAGSNGSVPIASLTKIMTALVILRSHPLTLGSPGPTVTVSATDFALYQSELAQGDSVLRVETGEGLTELQLLEALLLPSADNIAELLADWQAGSEPAFVAEMNQLAASLRLTQTHFADSSGLDPASVSSARDLVTLAGVAMSNPVFASIVVMPEATLPLAGTVHNYNPLLGKDGVVGIKTGWTSAALGCLVFASRQTVAGHQVELIGAVTGQPGGPSSGLAAAAAAAAALIQAAAAGLQWVILPPSGVRVGRLDPAWSAPIGIRAAATVQLPAPSGARLKVSIRFRQVRAPLRRGAVVGTITVTRPDGSTAREQLISDRRLADPSWWWRLYRPW
ncbi:MAG: D-alanyl-D-alanine carboxypeptidase [Candidatus Dormiibacterota bacterium]